MNKMQTGTGVKEEQLGVDHIRDAGTKSAL